MPAIHCKCVFNNYMHNIGLVYMTIDQQSKTIIQKAYCMIVYNHLFIIYVMLYEVKNAYAGISYTYRQRYCRQEVDKIKGKLSQY